MRTVRLFGDPVLRERAVEVADFDRELRTLVKDLHDTLADQRGAGLAAPQIGVAQRVFVYHIEDVRGHLVNPVIRELSEEEQEGDEGCLSFPGLFFPCTRRERLVVTGLDEHGVPLRIVTGQDAFLARCVQHEVDHLDGVLFIDRLDRATRKKAMRAIREAEWATGEQPQVKISPHAMHGRGL